MFVATVRAADGRLEERRFATFAELDAALARLERHDVVSVVRAPGPLPEQPTPAE